MTATINASTSSGLIQTADTSGTLALQSNGTTQLTVSSTGAYGQLKSGTAVSASGTSVDFTSIPSWVKRITVMFSGVSTNGTSPIMVQIGDSGGVENTSYAQSASLFINTGTNVISNTGTAGFQLEAANANMTAASVRNGHSVLTLVGSNLWVFSSNVTHTGTLTAGTGAGNKTLSDVLDRVRITTVSGTQTFDAGSINILYEG